MRHTLILLVFLFLHQTIFGQSGIIRGKVFDKVNNEPVPFANVVIQGTSLGAAANEKGDFEITGLTPGPYNVEATFVGYKPLTIFEVQVTNARPVIVQFALEEEAQKLKEIEITASNTFSKSDESPLSLRSIGPAEIKRTPGGNRDVSRVIRSLPGVASPPGFRNDIIIRGGAPSENTFYLDGIQIPVINHFQTQGSSGGPVGIINVDLLKEVNFYSGAFPANRGNTLSSVFDFQLREGRSDKWTFNGIVGATDLGVTFDGPVSNKSTMILSVRRSYLKFLFNVLNLPFLPVYNDIQFKYKYKFNDKNQITVLGIAAIDDFELNMDAPEKAADQAEKEEAEYILNILPVSTQWNYTTGIKYDHFRTHGNTSVIMSTNTLQNNSEKYQGNVMDEPDRLLQDYSSRETETRVRIENYSVVTNKYTFIGGINAEHASYNTSDYSKIVTQQGAAIRDFETLLKLNKWGFFGQASAKYFDKLTLSFGLRADANDYSSKMNNLFKQLSPRLSASYGLSETVNLNFNTGIYYQLPAYTVLGYKNSTTGELENKTNGVEYIRSKHLVSGLEINLEHNARVTAEGFYKWYDQYPFLVEDSISLANLGADFGVVGNAPVKSISEGRSYGMELLYQQKLWKGFYGLIAYTFVKSEFQTKNNSYAPSSWDNRHIVSLTGGKRFGKNWEIGTRWLFTAGAPYTPYNLTETVRRVNWDVRPYGIPDYNYLNTKRISAFHQLDVRLDKKYFFSKWSLDVYIDIQNIYNHVTKFQDNIDVVKDDSGIPVVNPDNADFYIPKYIQNTSGTVLPTVGIIVEL